jgi:hypothetical protein
MKTIFKPAAIQYLYRREPIGISYARLYAGGRNKWVSLKTKMFNVAKLEVHKHLQTYHAIQDAQTAIAIGKATIGDLSAIYLRQVELDNSIKASTKEYRRKTTKYLFNSWPDLKARVPNRVTETECREWAAKYMGAIYFTGQINSESRCYRSLTVSLGPTADVGRRARIGVPNGQCGAGQLLSGAGESDRLRSWLENSCTNL